MSANACLACGACCASFRVDFDRDEWAGAGGGVPETLADELTGRICRMRGTDRTPPRCAALVGRVGVQVSCAIHEWRPSPCREFGLRAALGIGDEACDAARRRHGLAPLELAGAA
ncbi:zinc/iron-chelating domain-containing protein [Rubrivivax gelatinosus]|uniref:YkgJ family cysteine cluster protein n=1 Tax=Rubrivivax gelatinosus TaxID=28068 RepID=UPI00190759C2|nr:zinc/iron-chelating domain-containing protein [Rubrivivax gelatinosus]